MKLMVPVYRCDFGREKVEAKCNAQVAGYSKYMKDWHTEEDGTAFCPKHNVEINWNLNDILH